MLSIPLSLAWAHPLVAEWFVQRFGTPTEPQEQGWPHILAGRTHADFRADRLGQNLGCVSGLHRPAGAKRLWRAIWRIALKFSTSLR
jgi:hypothetical protein